MRIFVSTSIQARLFRVLLLSLGGIAVALVMLWHWRIAPVLRSGVEQRQKQLLHRAAEDIVGFVDERVKRLVAVGEVGRFWEANHNARKQALIRLMKFDPQIRAVSFADANGREVIRLSRDQLTTGSDHINVAQEPKFLEPMQGKVYISEVAYERTAEPFITLSVPIRFTAAEISGAMIADISLKTLWSSVADISAETAGIVSVADENSRLIAHPDYSKVLLAANRARKDGFQKPRPEQMSLDGAAEGARHAVIRNQLVIPTFRWTVMVTEPETAALGQVRAVQWAFFAILGFAIAGAFGFSAYFSNRITRPVRELERGTKRLTEGDLQQRLEIRTGDEIESLAGQFNRMAVALRESRESLEIRIAERSREIAALYTSMAPLSDKVSLRELFEGIVERLMVATGADAAVVRSVDADRHYLTCLAQRGFPVELEGQELRRGSAVEHVFTSGKAIVSPDILADDRIKRKRQVEAGFSSCAFLPFAVKGQIRGVLHLASTRRGFFTEEKKEYLMAIARLMGIVVENSELLQASIRNAEQLQQSNRELARSNQDLEQFAYVSSHDLQEPLRMVTGFTQLLAQRYQGKLDKDADEYIGYAVEGARRMQVLVNDLLAYSRVGKSDKPREVTDSEAVLESTLSGLKTAIDESGAAVTHDPLPMVLADGTQLGRLFQNLVGNAIKYRDSRPLKIHISARRENGDWIYSVSDNGIGIETVYLERIFVIFQRLHSRQEYPGTGIGLAICKKIVERHGGKIWAESEPGEGSTFYFTIPVPGKTETEVAYGS